MLINGDLTGGFVPSTTTTTITYPEPPKVCPTCGYCPTCGRNHGNPISPWPSYPYIQPQWTYTNLPNVTCGVSNAVSK